MFKLRTQEDEVFMNAAVEVLRKLKKKEIKEREFDMNYYANRSCTIKTGECGTAHCIGGWIGVELGFSGGTNPLYEDDNFEVSEGVQRAADRLFNPSKPEAYNTKRSAGIEALTNFVKGRSLPWRGVKLVQKGKK